MNHMTLLNSEVKSIVLFLVSCFLYLTYTTLDVIEHYVKCIVTFISTFILCLLSTVFLKLAVCLGKHALKLLLGALVAA